MATLLATRPETPWLSVRAPLRGRCIGILSLRGYRLRSLGFLPRLPAAPVQVRRPRMVPAQPSLGTGLQDRARDAAGIIEHRGTAERFAVTVRTVFRILQRCREASMQDAVGGEGAPLLAA